MKIGFGKNKKKKQKKQQKKKGKGQQEGDAMMADVPSSPHPSDAAGMDDEEQHSEQHTAKQKLKQRLELKKALKLKVAGLKHTRNKLTKLASNKDAKRTISKQLQQLIQEQGAATKP